MKKYLNKIEDFCDDHFNTIILSMVGIGIFSMYKVVKKVAFKEFD